MICFNKRVSVAFLLALSICISSCGSGESGDQGQAQMVENEDRSSGMSEKERAAYKAKVSKRMGKVTFNAAVKELGAVGVSETQVKCLLKDHSYVTLSIKKDTPEVKAAFEGCGVDMAQLKGWYD